MFGQNRQTTLLKGSIMNRFLQSAFAAAFLFSLQLSQASAGDRLKPTVMRISNQMPQVSNQAPQISDQMPQVSLYDNLTPKSLGSVYSEIEWTYLVLLDAGLPEMEAYRIALDSILFADF